MPSTRRARRARRLAVVLCVFISVTVAVAGTAGAAVAGPPTAAAEPGPGSGLESTDTGCFPSISSVEFEAVGDVVDVELLLCFEGSVSIEGPGYQGVVNLSSDESGPVTLQLNTHLNGSDAIGVTSNTLDDVDANATANGSFEAEEYLLTVRDGSGSVAEQTKIIIGQRKARDLRLWRAPEGAASELQTVESIADSKEAASQVDSRRRLEDPDTYDNLPVATNETLVVAIEAHGLEGAMAIAEGDPLARFRTALQETNATFLVEQTPESVSPSREALTPDVLNSSATHLVPQPENDTYYLVIDTSRLWGEWEGTMGGPVHIGSSSGMGFAYRFSMQGGDLENDPPRDLQSADHLMVERFAAFPRVREERVTLAPEAAQELVVATTVAPGTEVTVTVSGGINRTLTRTVRPQNLTGTPGFVVSLDLSGVPNGTRCTVEFGDTVTGQHAPDGLRVVVREPEASLRVREDPLTSQSLVLRSVRASHPSIVAVYTPKGVLVGTQAVDSGMTEDVFVPLTYAGNDASSYRVVLYRDADRSRTLSEADERYRVGGMPVSTTVDPDTDGTRTETPTVIVEPTQPPGTGTPSTESVMSTTESETPTTEDSTPGLGVVTTLLALASSLLIAREKRE